MSEPDLDDEPEVACRPMVREYPEELLRKVDAALTKTRGNRQHALIILKLDQRENGPRLLRDIIYNTPWLHQKWSTGEKKPLNVADSPDIDRPAPVISPNQEKLIEAINKQDALMKTDYSKLFKPGEVELIHAIQTQYTGNLQNTLDLAFGGAVHSTAKMMVMLHKLQADIEDIDANPQKYTLTAFTKEGMPYTIKDAHAYRMEAYDRYIKVADLMRKNNTSINEATKIRVMADKMRREMAQADKGPKAEAGWTAAKSVG